MATAIASTVAALKFPPVFTASSWATVAAAAWAAVDRARGTYAAKYPSADGVSDKAVPRLTNGDVVTFVMAWLAALGVNRARHRALFPLWSQFAAAAYGWDPDANTFDTSAKRAAAWYPDVLLVELWRTMLVLARDLDSEGVKNPRLDMDGKFSDFVFQGEVTKDLQEDGASASFKIPIPVCKGPDGQPQSMRCKRVMKSWPYLCEEFEKCAPVLVDDPVTVVTDKATSMFQLVLLVGACWVLFDNNQRRSRRAGRVLQRDPHPPRAAVHPQRLLGSVLPGLLRNAHHDQHAHRLVVEDARGIA